ncbi:MAG: cupin domain-containing protein [Peptococcaceae bacterium]|jgi:quercetin dioxygenase-like cupin family protein|nr:cupin domain-containing protein [Peptococcaceae bacterium]
MGKKIKNINPSEVVKLEELVDYREGQVISRTLAQIPQVSVTLFALSKGEGISAHTTPGDALVQVLDGEAEITIGEKIYNVKAGESIVMPEGISHGLEARQQFKMLLTVIKG